MRLLWRVVKVVVALAIALPLAIIVLATGLGILGALFGLAVLALKVAFLGVAAWFLFSLLARLVRGPTRSPRRDPVQPLPPVDPHYEAAMRELDRELGEVPRR